jgi:hypothetical protein
VNTNSVDVEVVVLIFTRRAIATRNSSSVKKEKRVVVVVVSKVETERRRSEGKDGGREGKEREGRSSLSQSRCVHIRWLC